MGSKVSSFVLFTVLHDSKLTHTDLKPENILFVNSDFTMSYNVEKVRFLYIKPSFLAF